MWIAGEGERGGEEKGGPWRGRDRAQSAKGVFGFAREREITNVATGGLASGTGRGRSPFENCRRGSAGCAGACRARDCV
jgi:hypothetical protein